MPEIRGMAEAETRGSDEEEEEAAVSPSAEDGEEGLCMRKEVQRCWYCRLWRIWVVSAEMGSAAPDCEMSMVSEEGAGADVVVVADILRMDADACVAQRTK